MKIKIPDGLTQAQRDRPMFNKVGATFDIHALDGVTRIDLYDEIGVWGVSASDLRQQLRGAKDVLLRINSPGGDVFDGIAMYNDLVDHPHAVRVEVSGLAASAASLIAMSGDEIRIAPSAFLMVHNAWAGAMGVGDKHEMARHADDVRGLSEVLGQIDGALAGVYATRADKSEAEIAAMMDAETWISGADAVEMGFADEIGGAVENATRYDLRGYKHVPAQLACAEKIRQPTARDFERRLRDAGLSRAAAKALLSEGVPDAMRDAGRPNETERDAGLDVCRALEAQLRRAFVR